MRIAYLATSRIPSTEANAVHVMRMANAMAGLGHEVLVVARQGDPALGDVNEYFGTLGFEIESLKPSRLRGARPWIGAWRARRLVRRWKADVAYGRDPHALLCAANAGTPVGLELHQVAEGRRARLEARLVRHPNLRLVTFITAALERDYLDQVPALATVQRLVAADGADEVDASNLRLDVPEWPLRVGYVGHLYQGRGTELIIELARRLPDLHFEIVGGTREHLEQVRQTATDVRNLVFVGQVPAARVPEFLTSYHVVLAPYQRGLKTARGGDTSRWMSPLKIFEYMAHGRAIIASDLPVLREVLRHEENSLLVDPEDPDRWELALRRLVESPELRTQLGARARSEIATKYSWTRRAERILNALVRPR